MVPKRIAVHLSSNFHATVTHVSRKFQIGDIPGLGLLDDEGKGERRIQKFDRTEHQAKNLDENISGREQKRRESGGSDDANGSKSKLWRDMSLKRAIQDWNMKSVDVARRPGPAIRVFTSSERLANQLKINEMKEVGELVTKTVTDTPEIGKSVKKNEIDDSKVGKVGESWKIGEEDLDG